MTGPVAITSARLTYADADRLAHYEGGVVAKGSNFTASANTMDAYLVPRSQTSSNQPLADHYSGPGQLDHMVAEGNVVVTQPTAEPRARRWSIPPPTTNSSSPADRLAFLMPNGARLPGFR